MDKDRYFLSSFPRKEKYVDLVTEYANKHDHPLSPGTCGTCLVSCI